MDTTRKHTMVGVKYFKEKIHFGGYTKYNKIAIQKILPTLFCCGTVKQSKVGTAVTFLQCWNFFGRGLLTPSACRHMGGV